MRECPFCPKAHRNEASNLWTFGLFGNIGSFHCFRCGQTGDWQALRRLFNLYGVEVGAATEADWPQFDGVDAIESDLESMTDGVGGSEIVSVRRNEEISESEVNAMSDRLLAEKPLLNRLRRERKVTT